MSSLTDRPSSSPRKVLLLGSTGSIGTSALKVAQDIPDRMQVVGLAAARSVEALVQQVKETGVKQVALTDEAAAAKARALLPSDVILHVGPQGLVDLVRASDADMVLVAIVGVAGLAPALAAIEEGKHLAVASKEILVMAGEAVMAAAKRKGVNVLPVDSEHNAIFQCLEGHRGSDVRRLLVTASGGPFRQLPADQLPHVTVAQALKHPTWSMGRKITIDSATLFNKGLEMIEARWLFDVPMSQIEVVVHPQSIVHSMVEFVDNSVIAQLSHSDMCFPIQYAVTWPERVPNNLRPLDFAQLASLHFEAPRTQDFPALDLARHAGEVGGTLPAVLNAANEVAVEAFLTERTTFPDIWKTVARVMEKHQVIQHPDLTTLIEADAWARQEAGLK
ncbi:1-deoxy-D-xylulose-5-phosphate reductoisomerase [Prosthecobacter dejongeii]|uniref:1-deoxy-D-xylulose 5-phosphate reductoisomerase n=1 Tax=Prosthecobacter dejongeii TaxID=48465 RepID=A0A7W7YKG3_9BACT|nr:1-deoxy-D-xylulose-5-phosphate reductoisomerase [Prosthecobacter dejongeii]MBB5037764.1 1-deoxy-D-xylulose-5-phosphate reductoisomerase [Prosthecobacter dejongeii]